MKLKISDERSFSGLPQLLNEDGIVIATVRNSGVAGEIVHRVNLYDRLVAVLQVAREDGVQSYNVAEDIAEVLKLAGIES